MSPELAEHMESGNGCSENELFTSDTWALGVSIHRLLTGDLPFPQLSHILDADEREKDLKQARLRIKDFPLRYSSNTALSLDNLNGWMEPLIKFVSGLLEPNIEMRLKGNEAAEQRFDDWMRLEWKI